MNARLGLLLFACAATSVSAQETSSGEIARRAIERRAVEAVIWGMPAVNYDLMLRAALANGAQPNDVVYWSRPVDWRDQTLTPNPSTIYLNPFYDTSRGPVVLEIPAAEGDNSITGSVDDGWQNALVDVGPAGEDKGKGGKYLLLPPGYQDKVSDGYIPVRSSTFRGFVILRSNLISGSDADIAKAVEYGKRIKVYPLAQGGASPQTRYVDVYGKMFDATIPYDARFFESLDRRVQAEPWLERDKAMIDVLKTIGIEKGKPFKPDDRMKRILAATAREARAVIAMNYEAAFVPPYFPGARWAMPLSKEVIEGMASGFANPGSYPIDGRAVMYHMGYFSAKHLGAGQFYLLAIADSAGRALDGKSTYHLRVPANAPVKLYWSATAYDRATHALIREMKWSNRGSNTPGLAKNADGSVDLYFAPAAPAGKASNWVPTSAKGKFEVLFRFYGPEKPLFDKTWQLADLEEVR